MKIKRRTLAILLTLAMTLTLVPTVVFAGEKKDADPKKQQQRDAEIGAHSLVAQRNMGWSIRGAERLDLDEDNSFYLWVNNTSGETIPSLQYRLVYDDTKEEIRNWTDMNEVGEDGDPYVIIQTTEIGVGDFTFEVREKSNTGNKQTCSITVYSYDWRIRNAGESSLELVVCNT